MKYIDFQSLTSTCLKIYFHAQGCSVVSDYQVICSLEKSPFPALAATNLLRHATFGDASDRDDDGGDGDDYEHEGNDDENDDRTKIVLHWRPQPATLPQGMPQNSILRFQPEHLLS